MLILSQWNSKAIIDRAKTKTKIFLDLNGFKTHSLSLALCTESSVILSVFVRYAGYRRFFPEGSLNQTVLLALFNILKGYDYTQKPYHKWDFTVKPKPNKILLLYKNAVDSRSLATAPKRANN